MLGFALADLEQDDSPSSIALGTKAHPSQPNGLSPEGIRSQLQTSLDAMKASSVNEYYLHQPDEEHSLLDSLKTLNELIDEGKISAIGMSNYHASEVQRAFDLCKEHGLANKPSVYQGLYNPLNRKVEDELLPVLRENDCSFVAYNPLAAGLLTGKHVASDVEVKEGRFKNNPNYLPRFYTPANFEALGLIQSACDDTGISMVEATYRWLLRHSALRTDDGGEDGILIGASSMQQLEENLRCCASAKDAECGKLPQSVVDSFDAAWEVILKDKSAFPYWRSYSSDMPGKDQLDPGASYSAAKAK